MGIQEKAGESCEEGARSLLYLVLSTCLLILMNAVTSISTSAGKQLCCADDDVGIKDLGDGGITRFC